MTDTAPEKTRTGVVDLAGVRLGRATEHVVWILLSTWFYLEAFPSFGSSARHWEGPISWFTNLWIEVGLPGNPLTDPDSGVWAAFDTAWFVWLLILLSVGTCGLAVGRPDRWGLRVLSYLGIAGSVEVAKSFSPVVISLVVLGSLAVIAAIRCWFKDRDPSARDFMDYAPPSNVFNKYLSDVVLHYLLPLVGPLLLLGLTLQNFWSGPGERPVEDLVLNAIRDLDNQSNSAISSQDLLAALKVMIGLTGASRRESKRLALHVLVARRLPSGAKRVDE